VNRKDDRIVHLAASAHDEAQHLLPWLVTGRLAPAERARVEAHLAGCERCRAELAWEQQLQQRYAAITDDAEPERALAALRARLDEAPPARARRWSPWPSIAGWIAAPRTLRFALALQALLVVGLAGALWWNGPRQDAYHALSNGAASAANATAVVRFQPHTSEQALRELLRANGARVVDGPTATGLYLLSLPPEHRAEALQRLRADPAVALLESLE
jgi:anti-sigma factor RsiW